MCTDLDMRSSTLSDGFSYSVLCVGSADFIRNAAVPLGEELREELGQEARAKDDWPEALFLGFDSQPRADLLSSIVLGVVLFVSSWAATKLLDEVYSLKIQPRLKQWLAKADHKLENKPGHKPTLCLLVSYEDLGIIVLVAVTGESWAEVAASVELADHVHREALAWVLTNPTGGPVFTYVVEDGRADVLPAAFPTVAEALRRLDT